MHREPLWRKGVQIFTMHRRVFLLGFFVCCLAAVPGFVFAQATGTIYFDPTTVILNTIALILNYIAAGIAKLTLVVMEMLIIPILNYNSFSTSPIIGLGWSLVRDVMNMFVIVVLLFIAIFTIVGNHRAHWEQQLPQLFLAVIFMNFSRTICGILIDISQVIMFTFVNALLDIAAGNFAQLFQLPDFGKISTSAVEVSLGNGQSVSNSFTNFIDAFLQVPLYGAIFAILLLLALAFLYRIVILWILVILSPLAFFLGGIKGVFAQAGGSAANWWGRFTGALMMGPILTFFLWLALAAASSGSIAEKEGFPTPLNPSYTGLSLQVFDSSHLTSLLLALILLVVGMQVAGEQSSKVGGAAAQLINEGVGRRVVSGAVRALPSLAGAVGRRADVYLGAPGETLREAAGKRVIGAGRRLAETGVPLSGFVGQGIVAAGGTLELQGEHLRAERRKAAKERISSMSDTQKVASLQLAASGKPSGLMTAEDVTELSLQMATDKRFQKEAQEVLGEPARDAQLGNSLVLAYKERNKLDDATKTKLFGSMSENLDKIFAVGPEGQKLAADFVKGDDFVVSKLYNKSKIFGNEDLRKMLENKIVGTRKDKSGNAVPISVLDKARAGELGIEARDVLITPPSPPRPGIQMPQFAPEEGRENTYRDALASQDPAKELTRIMSTDAGEGIVERIRQPDLSSPQARDIGSAIIESNVDITTAPARQDIVQAIVTQQGEKNISKALRQGQVQPGDIREENLLPGNPSQVELVRSVITEKPDVSGMVPEVRREFARALQGLGLSGKISVVEKTTGQQVLLRSGESLQNILPADSVQVGPDNRVTLNEDARKDLTRIVKADPVAIRHFGSLPMKTSDDSTEFVVRNTSKETLRDLASRAEGASGNDLQNIRSALQVARKAVDLESGEGPIPKGESVLKKARDLDVEISRIEKLL